MDLSDASWERTMFVCSAFHLLAFLMLVSHFMITSGSILCPKSVYRHHLERKKSPVSESSIKHLECP